MMKDVIISITGTQGIDDQIDTIEFATEGRYGIKEGKYYLSYNEGQLFDSSEKVKTQIFINSENSVVLQRSGALNSRMQIERGTRNSCFYSTPHGDLTIGIFGENINFSLDDNGGYLRLKYTIDSNLQVISKNEVNITVREVKK